MDVDSDVSALLTTSENGAVALTAEGVAAGLMDDGLRGGRLTVLSGSLVGPRKPRKTTTLEGGLAREVLIENMDAVIAEGEALGRAAAQSNLADLVVLTFELMDILEGRGERTLFTWMFLHLLQRIPQTMLATLRHIPHYGCWRTMAMLYEQAAADAVASPAVKPLMQRLCNMVASIWARQLLIDDHNINKFELTAKQAPAPAEGDADMPAVEPRKPRLSLASKWAPRVGGSFDRRCNLALHLVHEVDRMRRADILRVKGLAGEWAGTDGMDMEADEPLDLSALAGGIDDPSDSRIDAPEGHAPVRPTLSVTGKLEVPETKAQRGAEMRYRKLLARACAQLEVVEQKMAGHRWSTIEPTHVPAVANRKYIAALKNTLPKIKHRRTAEDAGIRAGVDVMAPAAANQRSADADRILCAEKVLAAAHASLAGKTAKKIKGARNQVHELVKIYLDAPERFVEQPDGTYKNTAEADPLLEAMWADLVGQIRAKGTFRPGVPLVDVSGSMSGIPMQVAIAMGILMATLQPRDSVWYGKMITFTETPEWHDISHCTTLFEAVQSTKGMKWGMTTNFGAALQLLLETCQSNKLSAAEAPAQLFCFTDMQFDAADETRTGARDRTQMTPGEEISPFAVGGHDVRGAFTDAGFPAPQVIFWNLRADGPPAFQADAATPGLALMSGFSQECLRQFCEVGDLGAAAAASGGSAIGADPAAPNAWDILRAKLEAERYDRLRSDIERFGEGRLSGYKFVPPPREEKEKKPSAGTKRKASS